MFIDSEVLSKPDAMALYSASVRSRDPPQSGPVSAEEREQILENIRPAFYDEGYQLHVI